jgi:hypothetical protein
MLRTRSSRSISLRASLSDIKGSIQEFGQTVEFVDGRDDGLGLIEARIIGERRLQFAANCGERTSEVMGQRIGNGVQLVDGVLDPVQHVIEGASQMPDLIVAFRVWNPAA